MTKSIAHRIVYTLMVISLLGVVVMLNGCATPSENARSLVDRLEFDEGEYGSFELEGNVDLGGIPFFGAQVHVRLEKVKPQPE